MFLARGQRVRSFLKRADVAFLDEWGIRGHESRS